ncbi:MAG: hypothetical protein JXJ17_05755 [Anaerolineae bacterium]|nr:hypothetical protein [Anaerolineae bacterium]
MAQSPPPNRPSAGPFLAWVWAAALILGGAAFLGFSTGLIPYQGSLLPVLAAGSALLAVPFFARWLASKEDWWAPLTAWVFFAIAILLAVIWVNPRYSQIVAAVALLLIAFPFTVAAMRNQQRRWAFIPAYALVALAVLFLLTIFGFNPRSLIPFALLLVALPFWLAYLINRQHWWALIPAAAFSVISVLIIVSYGITHTPTGWFWVLLNAILAVVCLAFWLTARRFDWAAWLAIGFGLAALVAILVPTAASVATVALVFGLYIAYKQIDTSVKASAAQPPAQQPATQKPAASTAPVSTPPPAPAVPKPAPTMPSAPPTTPTGVAIQVDREATTAAQSRQQAGTDSATPKPVVEFRPIDPFKQRKEQASEEDEKKDES